MSRKEGCPGRKKCTTDGRKKERQNRRDVLQKRKARIRSAGARGPFFFPFVAPAHVLIIVIAALHGALRFQVEDERHSITTWVVFTNVAIEFVEIEITTSAINGVHMAMVCVS
jgi:hypothetical protein